MSSASKNAVPSAPGRVWLPNRAIIKAWVIFLALFGGQMALFSWADPWLTPRANAITAQMTAVVLRLVGVPASSAGAVVENPILNIEIIWECTGITPISLLLSSVVAFPCPWRRKFVGLALGIPALLAINAIRILSLIYIGGYFPGAFETAHVLVWQTLMIFFTVVLWLFWIMNFVDSDEVATA